MQKLKRVTRIKIVLLLSVAGALLVSACSASSSGSPQAAPTQAVTPSGSSTAPGAVGGKSVTATKPTKPAKPKTPVHIMLLNADGSEYGVGMPEIAYFSRKLKNAVPLQKATTVTVNGKPEQGAWDFEYSDANKGYPVEGHFRLQKYWPAHSKIHIGIAAKGVSAGGNLAYNDSLTSDWTTGPANISTVDDSTHLMTVTSDGKKYGTFHVSLGATDTPTRSGIKVIMEKGASICMSGPGYDECGIKYTQRLTYDGEYLHAAPWNVSNIDNGVDSSNGCTNLLPADAQQLYGFLRIGDVVDYPNANGGAMQLGQGYGDWNVSWASWLTGGLYRTNAA